MAESPTARQRETDAGYKRTPLGTPNNGWPTRLRRKDKNGVTEFAVGVIESDTDPLWLQTARKYTHVYAELMRDCPAPCMWDAIEAILANPLAYLVSDPAYGKSFLAELVGRAMHPQGAVIYDAAQHSGNLEALKFQTVFDSNASSDLVDRINSGLKEGTLTPLSIKALRELKVTKTDDDGKEYEYSFLTEDADRPGKMVFDWEGLSRSGIVRKEIDDVLTSVMKYQEWNGGLRIGFKDEYGALVRAAMEHRPLVIDEMSRRKLGSEGSLQRIWQCINGEKGFEQVDIDCGNLGTFTLRTGDIPKVIMTANKAYDGGGVVELPPSVASRFVVKEISAFTEEDWAHRICQALTGVPVTTMARLEKGHMQHGANLEDAQWVVANPDKFRNNLERIRRKNTEAVTVLEMKLIDHWQDVIPVSQALGRAFHESAALLDPKSDLLQQPDMAAIRMLEVDKPGDRVDQLTPRTALRELYKSLRLMPKKIPATETKGADYSNLDDDDYVPNIIPSRERVEEKMGDRIKTLIEHWIDDVAGVTPDGAKRPKLYAQLRKVWEEAGVIGPNSVLDKFNIKSTAVEATSDEVRQAQAVINNYLKAKYPGFEGVSVQQVELFLKGLQDLPPKFLGDEKVAAHVITESADSITEGAFTDSVTVASRTEDKTKPGGANFSEFIAQHPAEKLVDQDKAISTLALPYGGKELLQAISKTPDGANSNPAASYSGNVPCVITTTIAKGSDKGADAYARLHVIHNKQTGKSLVVAFTKPTVEMGRDSGVTVINAKDRNAASQVKSWWTLVRKAVA